jgi:hypothetical protein
VVGVGEMNEHNAGHYEILEEHGRRRPKFLPPMDWIAGDS